MHVLNPFSFCPERTFCTRAHYADTPHCRTRRDPALAPSASLNRALAAPCSTIPLAPGCAAGRALGGTPASAVASAMFGTAQTTPARQLPLGIARAYPHARRNAYVAATMPWHYREVVAGDLICCRRGASLVAL